MKKVGITGQAGFIGTHLYNTIGLLKDEFERIPFEDSYFEDEKVLQEFVSSCDVIVHLAAMNRHGDPQVIYNTNIQLVEKLIRAMESVKAQPHVLFSSSTQEERDNPYGNSKRAGREMLEKWAARNNATFTGMIIPNVFGPFGRPFYNSVIATFSHQLTHQEAPKIEVDGQLKLIYVGELIGHFLDLIRHTTSGTTEIRHISHTSDKKVSELLELLRGYSENYMGKGIFPALENKFEINLFNTFRCYMDIAHHFPVPLMLHTDPRGSFVEVIKAFTAGQSSFSNTKSGITRGNHYHTRKVERFAVIRGKASICMRKIGTDEKIEFNLDGNQPSFVDMPIWHTHNITNTGEDDLYTIFWINEMFDPNDPDTYFEEV